MPSKWLGALKGRTLVVVLCFPTCKLIKDVPVSWSGPSLPLLASPAQRASAEQSPCGCWGELMQSWHVWLGRECLWIPAHKNGGIKRAWKAYLPTKRWQRWKVFDWASFERGGTPPNDGRMATAREPVCSCWWQRWNRVRCVWVTARGGKKKTMLLKAAFEH